MEWDYKDKKIIIRNLMLAIIFMGFLMIVSSSLLPPDADEQIKETLKNLGIFFALMGLFVIIFLYIMNEMNKMNGKKISK